MQTLSAGHGRRLQSISAADWAVLQSVVQALMLVAPAVSLRSIAFVSRSATMRSSLSRRPVSRRICDISFCSFSSILPHCFALIFISAMLSAFLFVYAFVFVFHRVRRRKCEIANESGEILRSNLGVARDCARRGSTAATIL